MEMLDIISHCLKLVFDTTQCIIPIRLQDMSVVETAQQADADMAAGRLHSRFVTYPPANTGRFDCRCRIGPTQTSLSHIGLARSGTCVTSGETKTGTPQSDKSSGRRCSNNHTAAMSEAEGNVIVVTSEIRYRTKPRNHTEIEMSSKL